MHPDGSFARGLIRRGLAPALACATGLSVAIIPAAPHAAPARDGESGRAVYWRHRIYMATEYTASGRRDAVSNWSTRIWSAPVP